MMNLKVPPHVEIKQKLFKWNREINRGYERCICRYCNSIAMKQMFMAGHVSYFVCDKCANNIITSKMQICNDPECIFPSIRDLDSNKHYIQRHECQLCERYLRHLWYGFETHFANMDFSRSFWDITQDDRGIILADDRAIAVRKYLKEKSQI